jgi:NAD(P)-dependent dehydrogenase (short-subunit alcohol dehydrogenase family)
MSISLSKRLAVVTGASRGIGEAAAKALAQAGYHVIAVARTVGALEVLDDAIQKAGGSATLVPLDLRDYDAIDRLGASIFERWGHLDALVGNAGVLGGLSPVGHFDPKKWDEVFAVNVTANWRLIRSLDPLLKLSAAGRAVFITSRASSSCKAYWGAYSSSKAALDALVRTYAVEVENTPVNVNLLNPGAVHTRMRTQAYPGEDAATLVKPDEIASAIVTLVSPECTQSGGVFNYPTNSWVSTDPLGNRL